jgi:surface carbohydrate biosynthesis protein (TIGR04326 family)
MDWLVEVATVLPADTRYIVKAHPACPISAADYSSVDVQIADLPLDQLLRNCDVAYTGNRTSAAVEAYSLGVPVVSMLEGESLNVSPLRGRSGVTYVHNAAELGAALARARTLWRSVPDEYFWLDPTLPRWRELLRLGGSRGAGTVASRGAV